MRRLAVYLDIEGFSAIYRTSEARGYESLRRLMLGVYEIYSRFTGKPADRLFAHQFSDGFLLLQDDWRPSIDRGLAGAIGLLRYLLNWGFVGRAGMATGGFSDISTLIDAVKKEANAHNPDRDPEGVMTTANVMGDALINAYNVQANDFSGPLLFVQPDLRGRINGDQVHFLQDDRRVVAVDWLRSSLAESGEVQTILDIEHATTPFLCDCLLRYIASHTQLSRTWRANAEVLLTGKPGPLQSKRGRPRRRWPTAVSFGIGVLAGLVLRKRRKTGQ
jgi:hypothetical protein